MDTSAAPTLGAGRREAVERVREALQDMRDVTAYRMGQHRGGRVGYHLGPAVVRSIALLVPALVSCPLRRLRRDAGRDQSVGVLMGPREADELAAWLASKVPELAADGGS